MISWKGFLCLVVLSGSSFFGGCCGRSAPEGMVVVPAGPLIMGSDKVDVEGLGGQLGLVRPLYQDEHPQRKIFLPAFYIDRFEVTQAQYKIFTLQTGYRTPRTVSLRIRWIGFRIPAFDVPSRLED